jgi:putative membrane protein
MPRPLFTDEEFARIRAAVSEAERATAGEIVPYVVDRCGRYEVAAWRGGAIGVVVVAVAALAVGAAYEGWGLGWLYAAEGMAAVVAAGGLAGAALVQVVPALRRALAGRRRIDERVARRAAQAFVEEEVFNTRDRTGILLFVALFEHRLLVLGDAGINRKVRPEEWAEVVELVRRGIRARTLVDGLLAAIAKCGELLHRRGVAVRDDDTDELPDDVRVRGE